VDDRWRAALRKQCEREVKIRNPDGTTTVLRFWTDTRWPPPARDPWPDDDTA
jgi:hypothetical protein